MKDIFKDKCEIVRDLLPLFADNSCSRSASDCIEVHLITCKACRDYLNSIKNSRKAENTQQDIPDSSPDFAGLLAKIRRHKIVTRSVFAAVTIGLAALNISFWLTKD